jgi:hypothetical protein
VLVAAAVPHLRCNPDSPTPEVFSDGRAVRPRRRAVLLRYRSGHHVLWWRSPTCGSPCPRPARRLRGATLSRLPDSVRYPRVASHSCSASGPVQPSLSWRSPQCCSPMGQLDPSPPEASCLVGYADETRSGVHLCRARYRVRAVEYRRVWSPALTPSNHRSSMGQTFGRTLIFVLPEQQE